MSLDTHDPTEGVRGNPRTTVRPVTRHAPCPICKRPDWCEIHTQSGAVHCMRTESAHKSEYRGGGWWHNLPGPDEKTGRVVWSPEDFVAPGEDTRPPGADAPTKHAVYTALLALCPLSPSHRGQLLGPTRQLPEEALATYGTLPEGKAQTPILAQLVSEFTREVLLTIPGIVDDQSRPGGLRFNSHGGLLIPVRDTADRIQGMQVRADRGEPRYRWLSSAEGASSGTPAHVARPAQVTDPRIYLTEGPLKADIAARRLAAVVVGITGVTTWRNALPALDALQAEGYDVVVVALDADDAGDPKKQHTVVMVEAVRQEVAAELVAQGFAVRFARWDHSLGKGVDDLLLGGNTFALETYRPTADTEARCDDTEAQRRLRYLRTVIQAPNMDRTPKVLYLNALVKANLWPWMAPTDGAPQPPPRRLPIATIMRGAGVKSYNSARPCMEALRDDGLLSYTVGFDKKTADGRDVAYFQPSRPLAYDETPSKPAHLEPARERAEKARQLRCPCCAGDRLSPTHLICDDCAATFTVAAAEKAAAKYARREYEASRAEADAPAPEPEQPAYEPIPAEAPPPLSNFDRGTKEAEKEEIPLSKFDRTPPPSSDGEAALTRALVRRLLAQTTLDALSREGRRIRAASDYTVLSPAAQDMIRQAYEAHARQVVEQGAA